MLDTSKALAIQDWILDIFNKEGIAVFSVFCIMVFLLASIVAYWAIESGQFENIEEAKFDMMDPNVG